MKQLRVCLALLPLILAAPVLNAETCVQPSTPPSPTAYWTSTAPPQTIYECMDISFHSRIVYIGGRAKLMNIVGCGAMFYDVSGGSATFEASSRLWYLGNNDPHGSHNLSGIEVIDGFPYIMFSHSNDGWLLAKVNTNGAGAVTGMTAVTAFKLTNEPAAEKQAYDTAMWRGLDDNHVYIVGRYLEKNADINSIKIADLGTGSQTPTITIKSTLPVTSQSMLFNIIQQSNKTYLLQWGRYGLYVWDVSNPSAPTQATFNDAAGLKALTKDYGPDYVWGPVVINKGSEANPKWRVYSYQRGGSKVYIWDFNNPLSPILLDQVTIPGSSPSISSVASDGELLVVHLLAPTTLPGTEIAYYSVGNDSFDQIPSQFDWNADRDRLGEELANEIALFPGASQYKVFAASRIRNYMSTVQTSCLSTTPTAALGVARAAGQNGTPACQPVHTGAAKGFPGDSFTLTNQSSSGLTLESLVVEGPNQYFQDLTGSFGSGSMTWASPGSAVGEYTFTLKVRDAQQVQYTAVSYAQICGDPVARLAVTHVKAAGSGTWAACTSCSWLAGDSVRLSAAASDGHPVWSASNPVWTVQLCPTGAGCAEAPSGDYVNNGNGTLDLTLNSVGDYKVSASVTYAFQETPVATGVTTIHSGAVTAAFTAVQGTTPISNNGTADRSKTTTLTFTGQPTTGASCSWALVPAHWQGASGACSTGASIPAGTLQTGQAYTLTLTASVSSPVADSAQATLNFTATEISGDFSWSPNSPDIGQLVSFNGIGTGSGPSVFARWTFSEAGCDSGTDPTVKTAGCTLGCSTTFHFKSAGAKTVTLAISNDSGATYATVAQHQVTVSSSGSCTSCTAPSAPYNVSPTSGATVNPGLVSFSWTPSTGTSPISYQVYLGPAAACTSSSTSCSSTINTQGSYQWTVKATNSCGTATSGATSFTVGSAGTPPSAPVLASPANNANLPGGSVTFTWAASSGTSPITYDVNLGPLMKACSNVSATTCTTTISTATTYTWWVTAKNAAGSTVSETRTLIIGTPCTAPGAPTNPTPASGTAVAPGNLTFKWSAPTTGTTPFTYDLYLGAVKACSDATTTQCTVNNIQAGSSWYVKAKNSCSAGGTQSATWTFTVCNATAVPVADFTWSPKDPVTIGGVVQEQPYVGQTITFDPSATTNYPTAWDWTDFNTPAPWIHYTVQNPTHVWNTPGDKTVRLTATNCIGNSQQVAKTVKVYPDMRPVTASFTATVVDQNKPQEVTFTAATGVDQGEPNDFTWDFGDGATATGNDKATVVHSYKCGAAYPVKLTAKRIKNGSTIASQPLTKQVQVGGTSCSPQSLLVVDVARNLPGKNGAVWNTDLTLYNPTLDEMMLKMAVKRPDGSAREESRSFSLMPNETLSLEQVLSYVQIDFQKASLWFYQADPINRGMKPLPVISARTHTGAVPPYDDFGQFVMVYPVYQAGETKRTLYITGLRHNGKAAQEAGQGFRSNLTIVEPAGGQWDANDIKLTLYKVDDPSFVKERQLWAAGKYSYWQKSLEGYFDGLSVDDDLGRIILKIEIEPGASIAFGCSLINNYTNAPIFVPTQELP